jgi:hypothetical protein
MTISPGQRSSFSHCRAERTFKHAPSETPGTQNYTHWVPAASTSTPITSLYTNPVRAGRFLPKTAFQPLFEQTPLTSKPTTVSFHSLLTGEPAAVTFPGRHRPNAWVMR